MEKGRRRLQKENGSILKDWGGKLPFAFVYPNSYFIGMSNLGMQAIYGFISKQQNAVCERIFWDNENRLNGSVPLSVESQRPLTDFAVLAFSLNYELDYFNIAPVLRSSGIPLYSVERNESQPLIIAGGPCVTANPAPVASFFDCLCVGEAEALLPAMLPVIQSSISGKRDDLLKALSELPGLFVPRFPAQNPVERQSVINLNDYPVHSIVLTQDTELSDLFLIEVERGCAHQCRFCLVKNAFSPMRFHSLDSILTQAKDGLRYRKRIGLVGPAVTDHPQITDILKGLLTMNAQVSISSLRLTSLTPEIMNMLVKGGMRSVALAPEAGSESLRRSIKKGISEFQFLEAVRLAGEAGMQQLKLYFMIGLPGETEGDIQAIIDLTLAAKKLLEYKSSKTRLTLNISPFIPKAGTPFQRMPMAPINLLQQRIAFLKNNLAGKGIKINSESPQWSEVQTVLSRGGASLAEALADIKQDSLPAWHEAIEKHRIDVAYIAHQQWPDDSLPPWRIIDQSDFSL
jgi:radical SAM superfamily enzyme YgiQ (UPF0313 family)